MSLIPFFDWAWVSEWKAYHDPSKPADTYPINPAKASYPTFPSCLRGASFPRWADSTWGNIGGSSDLKAELIQQAPALLSAFIPTSQTSYPRHYRTSPLCRLLFDFMKVLRVEALGCYRSFLHFSLHFILLPFHNAAEITNPYLIYICNYHEMHLAKCTSSGQPTRAVLTYFYRRLPNQLIPNLL